MKSDMTVREIHATITDRVSNMPCEEYWKSLDYGDPTWNEWIMMAQHKGIDAVLEELNSPLDEALGLRGY